MLKRLTRSLGCGILTVALVVALVPAAAASELRTIPAPPDSARWSAGMSRVPDLAADSGAEYVEGEVIVRFKSAVSPLSKRAAHTRAGSVANRSVGPIRGIELARLKGGMSVESAVKAYEAMPQVLYAQPNYIKRLALSPNDTHFGLLWGLHNTGQTGGTPDADIDAPEAWDLTSGSSDVVVAVIDSGVDYEHPDLADNMWVNPGEIPGNGIDDDGNGYIDDIHGVDVIDNDGDPMDDNGHGTHCAGTVAAQGNNATGVAGVAWDASIMAIRIFDAAGNTTTAAVLDSFEYAEAMGARVVNCSWGGYYAFDQAEYDTIQSVDALFVFAAGNDGVNIDGSAVFRPAGYDLANILSVGATDATDAPAAFSNFGASGVDVFAPGNKIGSTYLGDPAIAPDAIENPVFSDGFDDLGLGRWIVSTYSGQSWGLRGDAYTSSPNSAGIPNYGNNNRSYLDQRAELDLSVADYPAVRFRVRCDVEEDYDVFLWGVYRPATADKYTALGMYSGTTEDEFITVEYDLREYAGRDDIGLWFGLKSDESISSAQGYDGVWLDDVEVIDLDAVGSGSPWITDYSSAYVYMSGTSMATPHVAGIAGLLLARNQALSVAQMKAAIMQGVDLKSALAGKCVTGGRVNALGALVAANNAPSVVDDEYQAERDAALKITSAIGVLANDSDVEGDSITAHVSAGPSNGGLALEPDGGFTYTPNLGWTGTDTFEYTAFDGIGYSSVASVTVTVSDNTAPATTGTVDRATPNGADGWYLFGTSGGSSVPRIALAANETASTYYHWGTEAPALYESAIAMRAGTNTLTYWSVDTADNEETPHKTVAYKYDPSGPTAPGNLIAQALSPTSVRLSWSASTDTYSGLKNYAIDRKLPEPYTRIAETVGTETTIDLTGLSPATAYTFAVFGADAAGWGGAATEVSITTPAAPPAPVLKPVYRFYNSRLGTHLYTASEAEKNNVIATLSHIFTFEGPAYYMNPAANSQPLYRFYLKSSGTHFYTANEAEKANVMATLSHVYGYEGPAYNVSSAPGAGRTTVYRFYHRTNGTHFYTASEAEKTHVQNNLSHVYGYEGPAFWIGK